MKRIICLFSFLMLISIGNNCMAQAKSRLTQEQLKELRAKFSEFKAKLNLSEEQAPKVKSIDSVYFEGVVELKDAGGSKLSKYRKFKSLGTDRDKQMKDVLNKDQYKLYQQFKTEMKDEFKANRNG